MELQVTFIHGGRAIAQAIMYNDPLFGLKFRDVAGLADSSAEAVALLNEALTSNSLGPSVERFASKQAHLHDEILIANISGALGYLLHEFSRHPSYCGHELKIEMTYVFNKTTIRHRAEGVQSTNGVNFRHFLMGRETSYGIGIAKKPGRLH